VRVPKDYLLGKVRRESAREECLAENDKTSDI
jgi:hypothetical protein